LKKLQWYSQDSIGVHPTNFYPRKDSIFASKINGEIKMDSMFTLEESKYDGEYWVHNVCGEEVEDPEHLIDVEIVELEITEKKSA